MHLQHGAGGLGSTEGALVGRDERGKSYWGRHGTGEMGVSEEDTLYSASCS